MGRIALWVVKGVAAVCVVVPVIVLRLMGFSSTGPAIGTFAATWMSRIAISRGGGVAAGSLYSWLQSAAMGGMWLLTLLAIVAFVIACVFAWF